MKNYSIIDVLEDRANKNGSSIFIESSEVNRKVTYKEFWIIINNLAEWLMSRGITKNDKLFLIFPNSLEAYFTLFAIWRIGAVPVPVNSASTVDEIRIIILKYNIHKIIYHKSLRIDFSSLEAKCWSLPENLTVIDSDLDDELKPRVDEVVDEKDPDALALVLLTSGSTGIPKAVMLSQRNLLSNSKSIMKRYDINSNDKIMCVLPVSVANTIVIAGLVPLMAGATVSIHPVFSARMLLFFWETVKKNEITISSLVPSIIIALNQMSKKFRRKVEHNLRFVFSATSYLSPLEQIEFEDGFNCPVYNAYGLTETTCWSSSQSPGEKRKLESVGTPLDCEIKIFGKGGNELKPGKEGRIKIRGSNIFLGYLNDPEETNKVIDDNGWLDTEDEGMMDKDNNVFISSRAKNIIIKGGENISPDEVSKILLKYPDVKDVYILGLPDRIYGEVVGAVIELKDPRIEPKPREITKFCSEYLSRNKIPSHYLFLKDIPKGFTGKVEKARVLKLFYETCESFKKQQ